MIKLQKYCEKRIINDIVIAVDVKHQINVKNNISTLFTIELVDQRLTGVI